MQYKIWLQPRGQEALYGEMRQRGHTKIQQTIQELLLAGVEDEDITQLALALCQRHAELKDG